MRPLSVQRQNMATEESLRRVASCWRSNALPSALIEVASSRGGDCAKAIVVPLEIEFPGMVRLFGMPLTQSEGFIDLEIETDESHSLVELVQSSWRDVTEGQNLGEHDRDIGVGQGALAIKVLREVNADAEPLRQGDHHKRASPVCGSPFRRT